MAKRRRKLKKSFIVLIVGIVLIPLIFIAYNLTMNKKDDTTTKSTSTTLTEEDKYFINKNYSKKELSYINKLSDKNKEKLKNIAKDRDYNIISKDNSIIIEEKDDSLVLEAKEEAALDNNYYEDEEIIEKLRNILKKLPKEKQKDILSYAEYLLNKEIKK